MCGIFCAVNINSNFRSSEYNQFIKLTDIVSHRGPDSANYSAINIRDMEVNREKFNIFLGHRRLSIIDLSVAANQPMTSEFNHIIYNGEIYNFIELRDEMIKKGIKFQTNSDTEVILKLYENYGEASFSKLNGMWSFIIVDLRNQRVVISRDRFSIKPLYIFQNGSEFYFASEIKQLIPLLPKKEINEQTMSRFLETGIADAGEDTFFNRIKRFKSKFNMVIDFSNKEVKEKQYWDYSLEPEYSAEETLNQFNEILCDSINLRLRSDVPIGVLLSGGLDSSSIALIANDQISGLNTYSIISNDARFSEENFIDYFSKQTGISNHKIKFLKENVISHLDDVLYHQDEPFVSFSIIAQYMLFNELKNNSEVIVVLSGQGADEALLGYLRYYLFYFRLLVRNHKYGEILKEFMFMLYYRNMMPQFRLNYFRRYLKTNNKNFLKHKAFNEPLWDSGSMRNTQILDIDKFSIPILTRYEDRNSMAHSLEVRLPFLDHRLVNMLINLPENFKLSRGWNKFILRTNMINLPEKIRWRRDKKGFSTPDETWLKNELVDDIKASFQQSTLQKLNFIDDKRFLSYYNSYLRGNKFIHNFEISRVYVAEKWLNKYFF